MPNSIHQSYEEINSQSIATSTTISSILPCILNLSTLSCIIEMERKESQNVKHKIKIVFLGDKGVGKSSIISKFAFNKFDENCQATIGVDFMTKLCKYNSSKYKLELWDTAGQEKYRSLIKGYLRGANACVFVYDQSNPSTFTSLIDWIKTFEEVSKDEQTYTILFGNKTDLVPVKTAELIKTKKEAIKTCPKMGEMTEMEGSAKDGRNIAQVFEEVLQNFQKLSSAVKVSSGSTVGQTLIKTFKISDNNDSLTCCYI